MRRTFDALWIALSGLAVGWIAGLSVSPVAHVIIESTFGVLVSMLVALSGVETKIKESSEGPAESADSAQEKTKPGQAIELHVMPIGVFSCCLALGASGGIWARTNQLLGVYPSPIVQRWKNAGLKEDAINKLLESTAEQSVAGRTLSKKENNDDRAATPLVPGLFGSLSEENVCAQFRIKEGPDWVGFAKLQVPHKLWPVIDSCQDKQCQAVIKDQVCPLTNVTSQ